MPKARLRATARVRRVQRTRVGISGDYLATWNAIFGLLEPNCECSLSLYGTEGQRFESSRARLVAAFSADLSVGPTPKVRRSEPRNSAARAAVADFLATFLATSHGASRPSVIRGAWSSRSTRTSARHAEIAREEAAPPRDDRAAPVVGAACVADGVIGSRPVLSPTRTAIRITITSVTAGRADQRHRA
jgi:hypothetical protein